MPRDLADVLHYFMPELGGEPVAPSPEASAESRPAARRIPRAEPPTPLPRLALPIGERDVVRAALAWNLMIETARLGHTAVLLAPHADAASPLWPAPGTGPLGTEIVLCPATTLDELEKAAHDLACERAKTGRPHGIVFVRVPPAWIDSSREIADGDAVALRWWLLLTSANRRDVQHAYELARTLVRIRPAAEVGVTVHGVGTIPEARTAFEHLARLSHEGLGLTLRSYGLLVDDLHVYRAIAAQRPIGLAHPQAPATRALMDVARLLDEDARSLTVG